MCSSDRKDEQNLAPGALSLLSVVPIQGLDASAQHLGLTRPMFEPGQNYSRSQCYELDIS